MNNFSANKRIGQSLIGLLIMLGCYSAGLASPLNPRVQIGLNLLPAVMAADLRLNELDEDTTVMFYLAYENDYRAAQDASQQLSRITDIRGLRLEMVVIDYQSLLNQRLNTPAAIFLVEKTPLRLNQLIAFSRANQTILFSPFKGDVAKGVNAGFEVTHKVSPAVNLDSLQQSNISLKSFFLRVAVKHGR